MKSTMKSAKKSMQALSSLKLSFAAMVALLSAILFSYFEQSQSVLWLAIPLLVLAVNLLFAMTYNPRIRQNSGLLMFHICLLAMVLLAALGQLTSMKGRVEIMQGQVFDSKQATVVQQGPWHSLRALNKVDFEQRHFQVNYSQGLRRGATHSQLLVNGESFVVGDNLPFNHQGYRFYTTSNKGYAVILNWYGKDGKTSQGAIHFPSYPLYDWKQDNQWFTPAGQLLKMSFVSAIQPQTDTSWQLESSQAAGSLQIEAATGKQQVLKVGQRIRLQAGELEFVEVRMWMGYSIFYNPWLIWFFAVSLVGVFGLAWHYYLKLGPRKLPAREISSVRGKRAVHPV
ncbi:cytochrome c biogenesis protein ResB [Cardiobacterium sp. AH-315-I02]|nr:cytochrome c biogenesis protein ResB [Cardiobacterium sp. AH-315-I02]